MLRDILLFFPSGFSFFLFPHFFFLLPFCLPRFGIRKTIAIGVIAWALRYAIYSLGYPWWFVVASLGLHGPCFVFFFVVSQIYVDRIATPDIRGSAQSLLMLVTFGLGMTIGNELVGKVQDLFTVDNVVNYHYVFLVPTLLTIPCILAFLAFFKEPAPKSESTPAPTEA